MKIPAPANAWPGMRAQFSSNRRFRFSVYSVVLLLGVGWLFHKRSAWTPIRRKLPYAPPDFKQVWDWEDNLPQHNPDLPSPEGQFGRYVRFSNQIAQLGFNNVLNEILMNSHLAYESQRSYVFQEYVWKKEYYPWDEVLHYSNWYPRTPLNALISGPAAGGPWPAGDNAPRAVNTNYFDKVCPRDRRLILYSSDIKPAVPAGSEGSAIFDHWKSVLLNSPSPCIEVVGDREVDNFPQTFDLWLWGSDKVLSLWERFRDSPTSKLLRPSPVVAAAVERNRYLFEPRSPRNVQGPLDPFDRMLAVHIRRGDYDEACVNLAHYQSTFYSWNLLPFLPDSFTVPPGGTLGNNTDENVQIYLARCLPATESIIKKILQSRKDYIHKMSSHSYSHSPTPPTLDVLYIMTNDHGPWLDAIIRVLRRHGFYTIVTTGDLILDNEQMEVNPAIDMEIARRAAVLVGNGWSSFTSNIVHQRLTDGKEPISIRFY